MSGVLIIAPASIALLTGAGDGVMNLTSADPRETWLAPSTAEQEIRIDLGVATELDSIFLGFTNAGVDAIWSIYSNSAPGVGYVLLHQGDMRAADSLGPTHHAFVRLTAIVTSRYLSIRVTQAAGGGALEAGILMVGRAFEKHREYGPGRNLVDTGTRQDLVSGGFGFGDGVVKAQFAFSFIDLTDAETFRLEQIKRDRGLRRPILLVEDADLAIGQNEAMHYGLFERFQARDSADPDVSRWAGSVIEWA